MRQKSVSPANVRGRSTFSPDSKWHAFATGFGGHRIRPECPLTESAAQMASAVYLVQSLAGEVGVNFRGADAGVAKEFLNDAQTERG